MIHLFTDFGLEGPYIGQVKAVLARECPRNEIVDLFSDLPPFNAKAAAYLLAAYGPSSNQGDIVIAVVDPTVGSARDGIVVEINGVWYVGPDNGIFEILLRHSSCVARCWRIVWRPKVVSPSFHGRDIFAPVASWIAKGSGPETGSDSRFLPTEANKITQRNWPDDLPEVIYIDHFGNMITGLRGAMVGPTAIISIKGMQLQRHTTYSDVCKNVPFCYDNGNGLLEIAVNRGRADQYFKVGVGGAVSCTH